MKAVGYYEPGSIDRADSLLDIDIAEPVPGPHDLIVEIKAISVNPADTQFRASSRPESQLPKVLGWDAAGVVKAIGSEVTLFAVGDEVFYAGDMTRAGTNAQLHAVDERIVGHKPKSLDWAQAAALPLTSLTAWELLFERLQVPSVEQLQNSHLLIINGAGGVGSILTQIASKVAGLTVIATASRPETIAWCKKMGAHDVIDHHKPLDEELKRIGIPEVEYVAGLTASDRYLPVFPKIIAPQGKLAMIDNSKTFDIVPLKLKAITVSWELMFTRSYFKTPDMIHQHRILDKVAMLVDAGVLVSTLTQTLGPFNAESLKTAHRFLETGKGLGKTVITGF
jgi:zinc-binding alcohol dehydrogenase family protein